MFVRTFAAPRRSANRVPSSGAAVVPRRREAVAACGCHACRPTLAPGFGAISILPPRPTRQIPVDALDETEDRYDGMADATLQSAGDGAPIVAGSGGPMCANGGGSSSCHLSTGTYEIDAIGNSCCTRDCTVAHETRHVTDHTGWGCCRQASEAAKTSAAGRDKIATIYQRWADTANLVTECNAYKNDVNCAAEMEKQQNCAGSGKNSDCCLQISSYKSKYSDLAKDYCARAPAKAPPCPNFSLATLLP